MNLSVNPKLKLRSLSRRERFLAALLLLFSLVTLYQRFVFEPQTNKINQLKTELANQQNVLSARLGQGWNDIPLLKARSKEIEKQIDELYLKVPNIVDEPKLLVDFYQMAKLNGLQAEVIKFEQVLPAKGYNYSTISIQLDVTGLNSDIYNFIYDLEQYPRLNKIYEVTFEPLDSTTSTCSLAVEFYVLGEIEPDPMDYPFMDGSYGKDKPHQIFDAYIEETEEDTEPVENILEETPGRSEPNSWIPENNRNDWLPPQPEWLPAPGYDPRG